MVRKPTTTTPRSHKEHGRAGRPEATVPPHGGRLFPQDPTACQADPVHQRTTVPTPQRAAGVLDAAGAKADQ